MAGKSGQSKGRNAGRQRLTLVAFAALLVVLFLVFAVAQGIGSPSIPDGDVAKVEGVPSEFSTVSQAEFERALLQQAVQKGLKKAPKESDAKYEELKEAALGELLDSIWLRGEAEELGVTVTDKQVETELEQIKKQNFKTEAAYKKFLKQSRFTQADVDARVRLQVITNQIQEMVNGKAGTPSAGEISDYYEAAKATQFTTKPSRDIRLILNKDKAKVEAAKRKLEADSSEKSWKAAAQKFSSDPSTKAKGGLQEGLTEELLASAGPLKGAIFGAATGELVGPIKYQENYALIEVVKLNPEKVQTLAEVRSQISSQLSQQRQQEVFSSFVAGWQTKWESRTHCAEGFVIERCSNYVGSGHPSTAAPGCYEADPKGGRPSECPAPVIQNTPALPGTTTILQPQGERLVQRPRPAAAAAAAGGGELPAGAEVPATPAE